MGINKSGQLDDVENSSYLSGSVNVSNTEVEAKVGGSRLSGRQSVSITNTSGSTIYYGPTGVTTSTGDVLEKKQRVELPLGDNVGVFLIASGSGPYAVIVQERS